MREADTLDLKCRSCGHRTYGGPNAPDTTSPEPNTTCEVCEDRYYRPPKSHGKRHVCRECIAKADHEHETKRMEARYADFAFGQNEPVIVDVRPRCKACDRVLAEEVGRPWAIQCAKCKVVTEQLLGEKERAEA